MTQEHLPVGPSGDDSRLPAHHDPRRMQQIAHPRSG